MRGGATFRGQPLLLLGGLVAAWVGLRVVLWQPLFPAAPIAEMRSFATSAAKSIMPAGGPPNVMARASATGGRASASFTVAPLTQPAAPVLWQPAPLIPPPAGQILPPLAPPAAPPRSFRGAVAHNLMLLAGLSAMELPPALLAYFQARPAPSPGVPQAAPLPALAAAPATAGSRWSGDAWLLLRDGGSAPLAAGQPSYGRSQTGAVLRYRLAPDSRLRPEAYLRGSVALAGAHEREAAARLSARPVSGVPVRVAVEARVSDTLAGTEVRPAVFAVTELPPAALPFGGRGEAYVQAGYVGGRFATAFVDGQARAVRTVVRHAEAELSAGAGLWGGAQKGAARLDIGPTAAVDFPLGDARGRVAADYRFRIAGDAAPASGPALTLSAGF